MTYRVYADGREFGIDYPTLASAQAARDSYARHFPRVNYYIRAVPLWVARNVRTDGPRVAVKELGR